MALDLKKFITRFVEEARDHLRQLGEGVASLEAGDSGVVHAMFRSAHTIKGSARMLKLDPITETAHRVEDLFSNLRDGKSRFHPEMGLVLQRVLDHLASQVDILAEIPDGARLPPPDAVLLATLIRLASAESTPAMSLSASDAPANAPSVSQGVPDASTFSASHGTVVSSQPVEPHLAPSPAPAFVSPAAVVLQSAIQEGPREEPRLKNVETVRVRLEKLDELIKLMGELLSSHARMRQRLVEVAALERSFSVNSMDSGVSNALHPFAARLREDVLDQESLMTELHDKTLMMR
ncbi:MAG: Hpt domain-containing protein, partial [Magnetococcales bacterium]|nr:Hpt domain-containing protein [Magnetococcales bacterium]